MSFFSFFFLSFCQVLIIKSAKQLYKQTHVLFCCEMFLMYLKEGLAVGNCRRALSADNNRHMETIVGKGCSRTGHAECLRQRVPWLLTEDGVDQLDYLILRWIKKSSYFSSDTNTNKQSDVLYHGKISALPLSVEAPCPRDQTEHKQRTQTVLWPPHPPQTEDTPHPDHPNAQPDPTIQEEVHKSTSFQLIGPCWSDMLNCLTSISSRISPSSACWERRDAVCRAKMILWRGKKIYDSRTDKIKWLKRQHCKNYSR